MAGAARALSPRSSPPTSRPIPMKVRWFRGNSKVPPLRNGRQAAERLAAAWSVRDGRLQEGERAGAAVETHTGAQGNRHVDRAVADRGAADAGRPVSPDEAPRDVAEREVSPGASQSVKSPSASPTTARRRRPAADGSTSGRCGTGRSPTSSSSSTAPARSGSHGVPSRRVSTERFPPRSEPSATPPTSGVPQTARRRRGASSRRLKNRSMMLAGWVASWVTTGP